MKGTAKPYHHGDLRRALLTTAMEMLSEDQGWQFTLRELARRAGVTHAAPYKHFDDKAALLAELALLGFDKLRGALRAALPSDPAMPREAFLAMGLAYVAFGTSNINLYRLMWSTDARAANDPRVLERANAAFEVLLNLIKQGQQTGWLSARDPAGQAVACWTQLHGLTLLTADGLLASLTADPARVAITELIMGLEVPRA
jgi:AcrR family transcriptional regulator